VSRDFLVSLSRFSKLNSRQHFHSAGLRLRSYHWIRRPSPRCRDP
jgi:hypothetical protein